VRLFCSRVKGRATATSVSTLTSKNIARSSFGTHKPGHGMPDSPHFGQKTGVRAQASEIKSGKCQPQIGDCPTKRGLVSDGWV
jgi:hypothetical protein